jgi:hypothetical protein
MCVCVCGGGVRRVALRCKTKLLGYRMCVCVCVCASARPLPSSSPFQRPTGEGRGLVEGRRPLPVCANHFWGSAKRFAVFVLRWKNLRDPQVSAII